jgi:hypothetical protein
VLGLGLLAGCGGGKSAPPATGADAPIQAGPLTAQKNRFDPDQGPKAGADLYTYVTSLGNGRYRLEVTNTSSTGFINKFTWFPGAGTKILAVTGTTVDQGKRKGSCQLSAGKITCEMSLRPPSCTCRGDGGTVSIAFTAKSVHTGPRGTAVTFGSRLFVEAETPVPYFIPGSPDEKLSDLSDLPLCAKGQLSTAAKPCLLSG